MSVTWEENEPNQSGPDSSLVKDLRAQLKEAQKREAEQNERVAKLETEFRADRLGKLLDASGVSGKAAGLVPKDIELSETAVKAWIDEYKDVLALKSSETTTNQTQQEEPGQVLQAIGPNVTEEQIAQWSRMQSAQSAAGTVPADLEQQQFNLLAAAEKASGGSVDRYLSILRGEIQI